MKNAGPASVRAAAPLASFRTPGVASFARSVSLTFGTRLTGIAFGIVTLTVTTRLLGAEGRGQYAVAVTALTLVLQFSHCGLHTSSVYFLARRPETRRAVGDLLFWFSLVVTGVAAAGAYALAAGATGLLGSVPLPLLGLALVAAPPAMFVLLAGNALLGLGSARWFNGLDLGGRVVSLLAAGLLFWWPLKAQFVAYVALTYLLAAFAYVRLLGPAGPRAPRASLAGPMFRYGFRAFLSTLFMFLVVRAGLFLVNALQGTAAAGRYSVALTVAEIMNLAAASVTAILFQRLSTMAPDRRWDAARRVAGLTAAGLAAMALGLALVSRPVFIAWFGVEFAPAVEALWWLLPGMWCLGVNSVFYQYLAASGMPWFMAGAPLVGVAANLLLGVALIQAFGIAGAAGAASATDALLLLLTIGYLGRYRQSLEREADELGAPTSAVAD